ncbi:acyl-homoserine-lactone synthase [Shimia biformata]|uniref:acyl-homoserine-lactone synthase n=1 Tax=Shimia biformata TaxID=1294299 RepID=UPI0019502D82|nr:acyl-homoserine-lactone synthase [Shimia biformata]
MLRYLYGDELESHPVLSRTMFEDRAWQFRTRQGWDVEVDETGQERDQYDAMNPLYVIWERPDGRHGGSMRLMPTTGPCMVNEHFSHLMDGQPIQSPLIWECTRFCLAPAAATTPSGGAAQVAAALMLAGGEVMQGFGVEHFIGVFDARMTRIYRMIGASPEVLGASGQGRDRISVGLWAFSPSARRRVAQSAGLSPALSRHWFQRAFGAGHAARHVA